MRLTIKRTIGLALVLMLIHFKLTGQSIKEYLDFNRPDIDLLVEKTVLKKGTIYFKTDSVQVELVVFRRKYKNEAFLYCIAREKDSFKVYTAYQIEGYYIENNLYRKHQSLEGCYFIRQVKKGKVDLYEREGVPGNFRFQYYLHFTNMNNLVIICPHENNINISNFENQNTGSPNSTSLMQVSTNGIEDKFRTFITLYMGDCRRLKNMVEDGFLTINNIPEVVEVYNDCHKL